MRKKRQIKAREYDVGYGKPPVETRFKHGQSGNPKGRRKGAKNVSSIVRTVIDEKLQIREGGSHREFAMASGEMSEGQFASFNTAWMTSALNYLMDGGLCGTFIDWRGLPTVHSAATALALSPVNLIVWTKTNAGMGSLYRSQHELLPLFKKGHVAHLNNVNLGGAGGRWRSNVWRYPGASSISSDARRGLRDHPTVKPTAMMEDALLDLTNRGEIVIDPFLGSGSTLSAAEKTGRRCFGTELIRTMSI